MATQSLLQSATFEQILLKTVRALPSHRATQVLDFARWLQTQPEIEELFDETMTEAELAAEEKAWEEAYLAKRDDFRAMARQALAELDAGETLEMVSENGKLGAR